MLIYKVIYILNNILFLLLHKNLYDLSFPRCFFFVNVKKIIYVKDLIRFSVLHAMYIYFSNVQNRKALFYTLLFSKLFVFSFFINF